MDNKKTKVAISWSGGKDGCLALYRTLKAGKKVECLVSMVSEKYERNHAHGLRLDILDHQAKALGIPLVLVNSGDDYERSLIMALSDLKQDRGVDEIVFGSLYAEEDRKWNEEVAMKAGLKPSFPVWISEGESSQLLKEFITLGFSAVICRASANVFDPSWAGRMLDWEFHEDIHNKEDCCVMGEAGEYHTFVLDGPIFSKKIHIVQSGVVLNSGLWSLDIEDCHLLEKKREIDCISEV
ncbi:diphthine--ammonia ligase [Rossellomorea vietnamensis]|uniref:Diphthine--ammonia ligase n=1 Tax=Rossellomorea vietnamensis TaxID=218284 RepID=A0A6I6UK64_9BACI|nr:diphthine--ammonia ligase [Rossellomorea vietnamensis]QHE62378.1 diphthine--ammonia ligase [Rossellomorea vietnamensis]